MLQELASYLVALGQQTVAHTVTAHPTDKDKRLVIGPTGVATLDTPRTLPVPWDSMARVEDFCRRLADRSDLENTIWITPSSATVYTSDPWRAGAVDIQFPRSVAAQVVEPLEKECRWFDHKAIVRYLRLNLGECIGPEVLARFRVLNWESARKVKSALANGRASLDAEAQSRVTAADDGEVMESFPIELPLFADPLWSQARLRVLCLVDLDVDQAKVGLQLRPGSVAMLDQTRVDFIRNQIAAHLVDDEETGATWSIVEGATGHDQGDQ